MKSIKFKFVIFFVLKNILIQSKEKSIINELICKKEKFNFQILIKPKISLIIPVHDNLNYFKDCLYSLLNQTLKEIEIILIDKNSSNDILYFLNKISKNDYRVILLKQNNNDYEKLKNYAINISNGEYISFLECNNIYSKFMLKDIIDEADNTNSDIEIYNFQIDENISKEQFNIFNYSTFHNISNYFYPFELNKLFRYSFIKNNDIYFQENEINSNFYFDVAALILAQNICLFDGIYYNINEINNYQISNNINYLDLYENFLYLNNLFQNKSLLPKLQTNFQNLVIHSFIFILKNTENDIYIYEILTKKLNNLDISPIPSYLISNEFHEKYLDNLYFKHINLAKQKHEENIIKKYNYSFKPKVSVIIPIFNVEDYIIECLDSISNQTLKEIEIICVNDGSTDNSLSIIEEYSKNDNRIIIINQINRGLSEARNTGVKYSNGEYIYFIDSDDYLDQNALLELYNQGKKDDLDIIYFDADSFFSDINSTNLKKKMKFYIDFYHRKFNYSEILEGKEMFYEMEKNDEFRHSACLQFIKRKFYEITNLSFYPGIYHEDNLFTLKSILLANRTFYIKKQYYKRRIRSNSIMVQNFNVKNLYGYFIVYCEMLKFLIRKDFTENIRKGIISELGKIRNEIFNINKRIPKEQKFILKKKFTVYEEVIFDSITNKKVTRKRKKKLKK
jgi:glycosyltransferase involved in cell wall biosynthesis